MTPATKRPKDYPTISFRPDKRMAAQLESRAEHGNLHATARRDLERYYATVERDLAKVNLTRGEKMLLLDVSNGTDWHWMTIPTLWAEVHDALDTGLDQKWEVDGPVLVAKLRALTPGQTQALVDAAERTWVIYKANGGDFEAAARAAGMLR